ncbi:hypothetical protein KUTeg_023851 [Tegillarca granosa]|uniref:Secreted protein n=1 Tax=Tegillarca granosa TaxID=220873 RepID=A0ABQ9E5T5_TEGGR|nr:hypothetical protein KUTeg_023851 [Tegillarca granosa]
MKLSFVTIVIKITAKAMIQRIGIFFFTPRCILIDLFSHLFSELYTSAFNLQCNEKNDVGNFELLLIELLRRNLLNITRREGCYVKKIN